MSHCSTFEFAYAHEDLAVEAFRAMGLHPSTDIVSFYGTDFGKHVLGGLGFVGQGAARAIVAKAGQFQLFFVKEDALYRLLVEHPSMESREKTQAGELAHAFQLAYVRRALERTASAFQAAGIRREFGSAPDGWVLRFGSDLERSVTVRILADGQLFEEVAGVSGSSCQDITDPLEDLLCAPDVAVNTTWKPSYFEQVDDQVMQVLRLSA